MFKKSLLLMTLFFALFGVGRAQTTVEIGDGTNASYFTPINSYYTYSITEQLYTAEEIGMAGTINSISFYWAYTAEKNYDITVYMANVDATDLTTGISLADADEVFDGNIVVPSTAGWVTIDLDTPFDYDGTSNLLIGVNKTDGSDWFSGNTWRYTAATNMARYSQNDYNVYDTSTTPGTVTSNRPNIQMDITAGSGPTCDKPETLEASNITTNSAVLTWTGGSSTIFNVEYKKAADEDWTHIAAVSATTYSLSGLTSATAYQARVQSVCSYGEGSMTSGWKSVNFNTSCGVITTFPWTEDFEAYSSGDFNNPCWVNEHISGSGTYLFKIYTYTTGTNSTHQLQLPDMTGGTLTKLVLPEMTIPSSGNYMFSIDVYRSNNTYNTNNIYEGIRVYASTNGEIEGATELAFIPRQYNTGNDVIPVETEVGWYTYELSLGVNGTCYIILQGESQYCTSTYMDNFIVMQEPTCRMPKNFAYGTPGKHSVELSWTNGDAETAWQLCLNGDETNLIPVTTNPYTLTGLDPETDYAVKLRANCGGGDYSAWTEEVNFTTDIACPAPTNMSVSDITYNSAVVNWDGEGDYELQYGIIPTSKGRGTLFYGFEDGLGDWTTIDGDGDGFTWTLLSDMENITSSYSDPTSWAYEGNDAVFSGSYINGASVTTTPDNLLVSPLVTLGGSITFYAKGLDGTYPEHFGVCVSTTGNTDPNDFVVLQEWDTDTDTEYHEYTVDLSAYSGVGYIAIRDFNVTDMYIVIIDNVTIEEGVSAGGDINWNDAITGVTSPYSLTGLDSETTYAVRVRANCGVDGYSEWVQRNFMTKSPCQVPNTLANSDVTSSGATLSWNGLQESYNIRYRTAEQRTTYFFDDFNSANTISNWWSDYTYGGLVYFTAGDNIAMVGYGDSNPQYLITGEVPDFDLGSTVEFSHRLYNYGSETTSTTFQMGYSTTTADEDAFNWGSEVTVTSTTFSIYSEVIPVGTKYIAIKSTGGDDFGLMVDNFGIYGETIDAGDWEPVTAVTSPYELDGLFDNLKYEWQVQGVIALCTGGVTEWSVSDFFTTLSNCQAPTDLEATDITTTSATLNWVGMQDGFDVRYRALEHYGNVAFADDFTNGIGNWTLVNCHDNSQAYPEDGYFRFYWSSNPPQYLISPVLPSEASGMNLSFTYARTSATWVETFQLGFSTTDNDVDSFTWEDEVTVDGESGYWYDYTTTVPDGAKYFAIKCTSDDQYYLYVSNFNINDGTIVPTGDWMEESVRDDQFVEIFGLEPGVTYEWQVRGEGCEDLDWSTSDYFTTLTPASGQTTDLTEGWNWFSIYVAIDDEEEAMLKLQESLGTNGLTIKSIDDFTTYASGDWGDSGDLDAVDNLNMYMIQVGADCTVELDGTPADPGDYEITILNGWNWVGFPSAEVISIEDAFADFEAADGDQIKTKDDYSTYADGWGDTGDLEELTPGQGFLYYSSSSTPKPLIISTGSGKRAVSAKPVVIRSAMPFEKQVVRVYENFYKKVR